jgi:Na+-driven multidrug efflux pump
LLVGTNQSRYLVAGTLAETLSNVLFDYLLIFGAAGFPELGFEGAAYASVLSEFVGMFVIYVVIRYKGIAQRFQLFADFSFSAANNKLILSVSAPLMFQHAISIISWQYFFLLIEHHGAMAMKVSNIMRNIFGLFGCFSWAFAATTNAMVSNLIGQGKQDEVIPLIKKIVQLSAGSILIIAILLNVFPEPFIALFGQDQAFAIEALPVLRVVTLALLMMSFSTIMINTVTASGNTRITFYIEAMAILFYCAYVYIVCEYFYLPITYGWMSEWLYWICLFTPSFLYVRSGRWKNKKI